MSVFKNLMLEMSVLSFFGC